MLQTIKNIEMFFAILCIPIFASSMSLPSSSTSAQNVNKPIIKYPQLKNLDLGENYIEDIDSLCQTIKKFPLLKSFSFPKKLNTTKINNLLKSLPETITSITIKEDDLVKNNHARIADSETRGILNGFGELRTLHVPSLLLFSCNLPLEKDIQQIIPLIRKLNRACITQNCYEVLSKRFKNNSDYKNLAKLSTLKTNPLIDQIYQCINSLTQKEKDLFNNILKIGPPLSGSLDFSVEIFEKEKRNLIEAENTSPIDKKFTEDTLKRNICYIIWALLQKGASVSNEFLEKIITDTTLLKIIHEYIEVHKDDYTARTITSKLQALLRSSSLKGFAGMGKVGQELFYAVICGTAGNSSRPFLSSSEIVEILKQYDQGTILDTISVSLHKNPKTIQTITQCLGLLAQLYDYQYNPGWECKSFGKLLLSTNPCTWSETFNPRLILSGLLKTLKDLSHMDSGLSLAGGGRLGGTSLREIFINRVFFYVIPGYLFQKIFK